MLKIVGGIVASCLLLFGQAPPSLDDQTAIQMEALSRLKGMDLESNPGLKSSVLKVLEKTKGTPQFVELVRDFNLKDQGRALMDYALKYSNESSGVEAFKLALTEVNKSALQPMLAGTNGPALIRLIGNSKNKELSALLEEVLKNSKSGTDLRREAVRALAQTPEGASHLIEIARKDELPPDVKLLVSSELNFASWPEIRKAAAEVLPLPQSQNAEPLPPISQLAERKGNPVQGAEIFSRPTTTCINCHIVNGKGLDFGPNLSEIGTKLGKDALYESILDPSAGISFGFEAWSIEMTNGEEAFGLIVSETNDELAVKTQNGIVTRYKKADIAKRQKQSTSIMPAGLQLTMTTQELIDLVEYLSSLKKAP